MLFADMDASTGFWLAIIGAVFVGLNTMLNTYLSFKSNQKINTVKSEQKVVVSKLDDAARKIVAAKGENKSILDTQVRGEINEIYKATNGQMTDQFTQLKAIFLEHIEEFKGFKTEFQTAMASLSGQGQ